MFNYLLLMSTKINLTLLLVDAPLVLFVLKAYSICAKNYSNLFISIFSLFSLYVLLSGFAYCLNGTPPICYLKGIQYFFVPLTFAALGYSFSCNYDYYKLYLYSCATCFVIGFFLYTTLPPYYMEYLAEVQGFEGFSQDELMGAFRFSSFLPGSYNISFLSVPALIMSLSLSSNSKSGMNRWLCYFIAAISFIAAIICQQRIAMFFAIVVVLFYSFYFFKHGNKKLLFVCVGIFILLIIAINLYLSEMELFDALKDRIFDRFEKMDVSVAMSSRTGQYSGFSRETWWSCMVGLGMGSCGHLVIPYGIQSINDGELVKTFYEYGMFGTTLFAVLVIVTLLRGIKLFRFVHPEVLIMLFFLGASVGASALTFFIYNSMFWFSMGRIWNQNYLALRRQEMSKKL